MVDIEALTPGGSGEPVTELQQRLYQLGYYDGQVDGQYGTKTEESVRAFQQAYGQAEDGVVSYETWEAVERDSDQAGYSSAGYDQSQGYGTEYQQQEYDQSQGYGTEYQQQEYDQSQGYGTEYQQQDPSQGYGTEYQQQEYDPSQGYDQSGSGQPSAEGQQETEPRQVGIDDEADDPLTEEAVPA